MGETTSTGAGSGLLCRWCKKPVRLEPAGDGMQAPPRREFQRAVHAETGEETGLDGHVASPIDFRPGGGAALS